MLSTSRGSGRAKCPALLCGCFADQEAAAGPNALRCFLNALHIKRQQQGQMDCIALCECFAGQEAAAGPNGLCCFV